MARKPKASKQVETLTHEDASRTNIPTAEYQAVIWLERNPTGLRAAGRTAGAWAWGVYLQRPSTWRIKVA